MTPPLPPHDQRPESGMESLRRLSERVRRSEPDGGQPMTVRASDPSNPRRRDVMSAASVFAVMVLALGLAAIFNSGRQEERASQQPFGPARDRALQVWGPIDAVADPLGLQAPRQLFDVIRYGPDDSDSIEPGASLTTSTTSPTSVVPPPSAPEGEGTEPVVTTTTAAPIATTTTLRTPTEADPLRVSVIGDSTIDGPGRSLQRMLANTGIARSTFQSQPSSGFSRPDFYDWPARVQEIVGDESPELVIAMFGANDAQGFSDQGEVHNFGTDGWNAVYGARVRATMEFLVQDGRQVIWIGQPRMRSGDFDEKIATVNAIVRAQAEAVEGVEYFDANPVLAPNGYQAFGPGADGSEKRLRSDDGIHLTTHGGEALAAALFTHLEARGFLPSS